MPYLARRETDTLYCTDPGCSLAREQHPQEFDYWTDSWESPAEWIDEPECKLCGEQCWSEPMRR